MTTVGPLVWAAADETAPPAMTRTSAAVRAARVTRAIVTSADGPPGHLRRALRRAVGGRPRRRARRPRRGPRLGRVLRVGPRRVSRSGARGGRPLDHAHGGGARHPAPRPRAARNAPGPAAPASA